MEADAPRQIRVASHWLLPSEEGYHDVPWLVRGSGRWRRKMSVEQRSLEEVVLAYIEAWNTPDEEARRTLLDRCWADDAT